MFSRQGVVGKVWVMWHITGSLSTCYGWLTLPKFCKDILGWEITFCNDEEKEELGKQRECWMFRDWAERAWWVCNVDKEKDGKGSEKGGVVLNEQENPVLLQRPVKVSACGFWWINQQQHLRPQKEQELIAQSCSDRLVRAAEQRITGGGWCTCSWEGHLVAEYNAELRPRCIRETLKLIMCLQVAEKTRFSINF